MPGHGSIGQPSPPPATHSRPHAQTTELKAMQVENEMLLLRIKHLEAEAQAETARLKELETENARLRAGGGVRANLPENVLSYFRHCTEKAISAWKESS